MKKLYWTGMGHQQQERGNTQRNGQVFVTQSNGRQGRGLWFTETLEFSCPNSKSSSTPENPQLCLVHGVEQHGARQHLGTGVDGSNA
jgi:hypothetical protein